MNTRDDDDGTGGVHEGLVAPVSQNVWPHFTAAARLRPGGGSRGRQTDFSEPGAGTLSPSPAARDLATMLQDCGIPELLQILQGAGLRTSEDLSLISDAELRELGLSPSHVEELRAAVPVRLR